MQPYLRSRYDSGSPDNIELLMQHRFIDKEWAVQLRHWNSLLNQNKIKIAMVKEIGLSTFKDFSFNVVPWLRLLNDSEREIARSYMGCKDSEERLRLETENDAKLLYLRYYLERNMESVNKEIRMFVVGSFVKFICDKHLERDGHGTINATPTIRQLLDNLPNIKIDVKTRIEEYYSVLCKVERINIKRGTPVYSSPLQLPSNKDDGDCQAIEQIINNPQ